MLARALILVAVLNFQQDDESIDRIRKEVKESPTTPDNLDERAKALMLWARKLLREGVKIDGAMPRRRAEKLRRLIDDGKTEEACRLVDDLFRRMEKIVPCESDLKSIVIDLKNPTSGAKLWAEIYVPGDASESNRRPAVVVIPGGPSSGRFLRIFNGRKTTDEEWWAEREAVRTIRDYPGVYLRIQQERDHVHGSKRGHALDIIRSATAAGVHLTSHRGMCEYPNAWRSRLTSEPATNRRTWVYPTVCFSRPLMVGD